MKKILCLLLCFILPLSITACSSKTSNQKTEEELKAEIRAEMEAEKEQEKESEEKITTLKGTILPNYIPMGVGISLDTPIIIDGRKVLEVYFYEDIITDLIPRKYFTYYLEGGISINEEYTKQIPIIVEIDPDSFDYHEDLSRTSAIITKVVSIDGEENPKDKTNNEYTLDFYKAVFYAHCYTGNDIIPGDVKDTYFYKKIDDPVVGDVYRTAVDKILENGLFIQMAEGEYMINETEQKYSDGEIEPPTVFNIENLKNGDTISGDMIINNIEYTKGSDTVKFDLLGDTIVTGSITYDGDYYEGYILIVDNPYMFNSEIQITLSENYTFNYKPGTLFIRNDSFISDEYKKALKQGRKLAGKISIKDISFSAKLESEGGESCQITDFLDVSLID